MNPNRLRQYDHELRDRVKTPPAASRSVFVSFGVKVFRRVIGPILLCLVCLGFAMADATLRFRILEWWNR